MLKRVSKIFKHKFFSFSYHSPSPQWVRGCGRTGCTARTPDSGGAAGYAVGTGRYEVAAGGGRGVCSGFVDGEFVRS